MAFASRTPNSEANSGFNNVLRLEVLNNNVAEYMHHLRAHPKDFITLFGLAETFRQLEKFDDALKYYGKVLEIKPDFIGALSGTADIFMRSGKFDKALEYYDKVLEIKPDFEDKVYNNSVKDAEFNKGVALLKSGKTDDAINWFARIMVRHPKDEVLLQSVMIEVQEYNMDRAWVLYDKIKSLWNNQDAVKI
jgi:tetratricopeptide (TPR) repeat protein